MGESGESGESGVSASAHYRAFESCMAFHFLSPPSDDSDEYAPGSASPSRHRDEAGCDSDSNESDDDEEEEEEDEEEEEEGEGVWEESWEDKGGGYVQPSSAIVALARVDSALAAAVCK